MFFMIILRFLIVGYAIYIFIITEAAELVNRLFFLPLHRTNDMINMYLDFTSIMWYTITEVIWRG